MKLWPGVSCIVTMLLRLVLAASSRFISILEYLIMRLKASFRQKVVCGSPAGMEIKINRRMMRDVRVKVGVRSDESS